MIESREEFFKKVVNSNIGKMVKVKYESVVSGEYIEVVGKIECIFFDRFFFDYS